MFSGQAAELFQFRLKKIEIICLVMGKGLLGELLLPASGKLCLALLPKALPSYQMHGPCRGGRHFFLPDVKAESGEFVSITKLPEAG